MLVTAHDLTAFSVLMIQFRLLAEGYCKAVRIKFNVVYRLIRLIAQFTFRFQEADRHGVTVPTPESSRWTRTAGLRASCHSWAPQPSHQPLGPLHYTVPTLISVHMRSLFASFASRRRARGSGKKNLSHRRRTLWALRVCRGDAVQPGAFLWQEVLRLLLSMTVHSHHRLPGEKEAETGKCKHARHRR